MRRPCPFPLYVIPHSDRGVRGQGTTLIAGLPRKPEE